MSPIEYIAEGIRTGNWDIVCEGYERLTGEALSTPSAESFIAKLTIRDAEDALRQVADILSNVLDVQQTPTTKPQKASNKKVGRPRGSKKQVAKKPITVNEDGEDNSLKLDSSQKTVTQKQVGGTRLITNEPDLMETARNKILAEKARVNKDKVKRPQTKNYDVNCNECDGKFVSDRPGGKMGQKCGKCLREKKGRFHS